METLQSVSKKLQGLWQPQKGDIEADLKSKLATDTIATPWHHIKQVGKGMVVLGAGLLGYFSLKAKPVSESNQTLVIKEQNDWDNSATLTNSYTEVLSQSMANENIDLVGNQLANSGNLNLQYLNLYSKQEAVLAKRATPVTAPFQINAIAGGHYYPDALALSNGFVVAWGAENASQDGSLSGVYCQLYDAAGAKVGSEFLANTYTTNIQRFPRLALLTNGNFVVTWASLGQDSSNYGVYGQIFTAAGAKVESEFQVNTYTTNIQDRPSVTSLANGNFMVVWYSQQDGSSNGIYGQVFNNTGSKVGSEFQINTYTTNSQYLPSIVELTNGNVVVVWNSDGQDGSSIGVYAQILNSSGGKVGSEFRVNTYTTNLQATNNGLTALTNGNFVVTWQSSGQDGSSTGVYAQIFTAAGATVGNEFRVNTATANAQEAPAVTALDTGGFIIVWESRESATRFGFDGQEYDAAGTKLGTVFSLTTGSDQDAAIITLPNNQFFVAWTRNINASTSSLYGRILTSEATATPVAVPISTPIAAPVTSPSSAPTVPVSVPMSMAPLATPMATPTASPTVAPNAGPTSITPVTIPIAPTVPIIPPSSLTPEALSPSVEPIASPQAVNSTLSPPSNVIQGPDSAVLGGIIGGSIGGAALISAAVGLGIFFHRKRKGQKDQTNSVALTPTNPPNAAKPQAASTQTQTNPVTQLPPADVASAEESQRQSAEQSSSLILDSTDDVLAQSKPSSVASVSKSDTQAQGEQQQQAATPTQGLTLTFI